MHEIDQLIDGEVIEVYYIKHVLNDEYFYYFDCHNFHRIHNLTISKLPEHVLSILYYYKKFLLFSLYYNGLRLNLEFIHVLTNNRRIVDFLYIMLKANLNYIQVINTRNGFKFVLGDVLG